MKTISSPIDYGTIRIFSKLKDKCQEIRREIEADEGFRRGTRCPKNDVHE